MNFMEFSNKLNKLLSLPNIEHKIIGYSVLGRPIYMFHAGPKIGNQVFIDGGIHAREYVTSLALFKLIEYLNNNPPETGIYIVPVVNLDGIALVLNGLNSIADFTKRNMLKSINNGNEDFSLWKANANGVDLNVNFDAYWGKGVQNVFTPSPANFVGYSPNSEPETKAVIKGLLIARPDLTFSIHTKGEVVYYGFDALSEKSLQRDKELAQKIATLLNYYSVKTSGSVGGVQDFVSLVLDVPAFTIELGNNKLPHPIGEEYADEFFDKLKILTDNIEGFFDYAGVFWC